MKYKTILCFLIIGILPYTAYGITCEEVIAQATKKATAFYSEFQRKLKSSKPTDRLIAIQMLRELSPAEIHTSILPLVEDPNPQVRITVLRTLIEYPVLHRRGNILNELTKQMQTEPIPDIRALIHETIKKLKQEIWKEALKQGDLITSAIRQLDAHILQTHRIYRTIGIQHILELDIFIDNILDKEPEEWSSTDTEVFQAFQIISQSSKALRTVLLTSPIVSYDHLIPFPSRLLKGHPSNRIYINNRDTQHHSRIL